MSEKKHEHGHHHGHERKPPHVGWAMAIAIALMLAAMAGYIMTMDESVPPGAIDASQQVPAVP